MVDIEEYFDQSEHALKSLFDCLNHYKELARMSVAPVKAIRHSGRLGEFEEKYLQWRSLPEVKENFEFANYAKEEFYASKFSMHVVCGSILQISCKAIELFSSNHKLDEASSFLFQKTSQKAREKTIKFAIGRVINSVPAGLVIYAGRNQYNHFEEEKLSDLNTRIFDSLARNHGGDYIDPAFDLQNNIVGLFSSNICSILDWNSYENYILDIKSIIESSTNA